MQLSQISDTAMNTAVGTVAIVGAPTEIVDIETAKATLIALASSVIFKLAVSGFQWLSRTISKIGKKDDDDDNKSNPTLAVSSENA